MFVGANVIQPLIDAAKAVLDFFHDSVGLGWGMSIIALTVVVRAALIPLTLKQFRSMQALQRLQPEIKSLQAKYKDDKQRLNQEMMKFYQENKVNPLGSCLPLLAQLPVFLALFYMLRTDLKKDICNKHGELARYIAEAHKKIESVPCSKVPGQKHSAEFLFIPDLTSKATGAVLITLILLYVGSQLASTLLMSVTADKNQRRLFAILPIFFVVIIINFPAGLIVYWITTNLWTIAQQYIVKRTVGPMRPPVPAGGPAEGGGDDGGKKAQSTPSGDGRRGGDGAKGGPPPPPPRKKKKARSGRRR
jgi:YidC/Oxa1 family membrane protein insertase